MSDMSEDLGELVAESYNECDCELEDYCEEKKLKCEIACKEKFYQSSELSVPVKIRPFAQIGRITTACYGAPVITPGSDCQGDCDQVCEFVITQKLCVELPIRFGADVKTKAPRVQCGCMTESECDCKNTSTSMCD
ncbi:MAG: hypothetical protein R3Y67_00415 [Eubacteriales bacterium]